MGQTKKYLIYGLLIISFGAIAFYWWSNQTIDSTKLVFLDVGQGDAIYFRTLNNQDILIDGGPDDQVVRRLGEVMPFWDRTIELMVLTHPDADHVTGLVEVFNYYSVEKILLNNLSIQSQIHQELYSAIEKQGTKIIELKSGDQLNINDQEKFTILFPFTETDLESLDRNNTSYVMEYNFIGDQITSVLLTGDIEAEIEKEIVEAKILNDVDILKVAHHGSKSSSIKEFINIVNPAIAVIQVGKDNKFNHPHIETIETISPYAEILCNDELENIEFSISNQGYILKKGIDKKAFFRYEKNISFFILGGVPICIS